MVGIETLPYLTKQLPFSGTAGQWFTKTKQEVKRHSLLFQNWANNLKLVKHRNNQIVAQTKSRNPEKSPYYLGHAYWKRPKI